MIFNYFLILATLLLLSGLAIDAGMLEWNQTHLQNAADAAALEGMYELGRNDASWATAARAQATANGFTNGNGSTVVTTVNPPAAGSYAGDMFSVQATISQSFNNMFMALVNGAKSTVAATAIAKVIPTCLWIMDPSDTNSPLWLASSGMNANCGVFVSTSSQSYGIDGFASLSSLRNRAVGGSTTNSSSGYVGPAIKFNAAAKNDPLAYVAAPTWSGCNYNKKSLAGTTTISPGSYCQGLTSSNATVTFSPGMYIVAGGLSFSGGTITGSGVTIYLTKEASSTSYATATFQNTTMTISAPTSSAQGGIPGVLIFADRNWVDHSHQDVYIQSSTIQGDGLWYLPNVGLSLYNSSFGYAANYNGLVIDNIYQYLGHTWLYANYSAFSYVSPLHYEDGVLVQ